MELVLISVPFKCEESCARWARKQTQFAKHGSIVYICRIGYYYFACRTITERDKKTPTIVDGHYDIVTYYSTLTTRVRPRVLYKAKELAHWLPKEEQ